MAQAKPLLVCIVGPTAIGKTTLSLAIGRAFGTEIISADSRQFFKEMNIGTAVPSNEELAAVPHHFIQFKSIFEPYSVGDFERDALSKLSQLFKNNSIVVMVGGSGLYIDAIVKGLDEFPIVSEEVRQQLNEEFEKHGIEILQEELKNVDPVYFNEVDIQNPQRVIRALEVFRSSGLPFSSFRLKGASKREFNTLFIGLTAERDIIYDRINKRVDQMMEIGLLDEVTGLLPYKELNALQTVGYRELFKYIEGTMGLDSAVEEIKKNTRRFAKRQLTWFNKNKNIAWFSIDTPSTEIIKYIEKALQP